MNRKIGILGCGGIAHTHAQAIDGIANAELVGVTDKNFDNASKFADAYNTKAYQSYEAMLSDSEIDIISICTPSGFHQQTAIDALNAKKHVIVEKPMALSVEGCDAIIDASVKNDRLVTVISQMRFADNFIKVKRLIEDGRFGRILSAELSMKYWRDSEYYSSSSWRGTVELDGGGALMNQGIHGVDLMIHLLGEPKVLFGKTKAILHDIEVEDIAIATLEFENGAQGVIQATTCLYPGFSRKLSVYGTDGYVIMNEDVVEEIMIDKKMTEWVNNSTVNPDSARNPTAMDAELHRRQIQNLVNAIDGSEKLYSDVNEGKKAVKLICDIYNKSKENK